MPVVPVKRKIRNLYNLFYDLNPVKLIFIMVLFHLPYLIAYFPGLMIYDSGSSIAQFYGFKTLAVSLSNTPDAIYTNHHMIIFNFLMGGFVRLGEMLGSQNFGFFLYILFQVIATSVVFVYSLNILRPYIKQSVFFILFIIYAVSPVISIWMITMGKDSFFSAAFYMLTALLFCTVKTKGEILKKRKFRIQMLITAVLIIFSKQQGVYIIIFTSIILMLVYRKSILKIFCTMMLPSLLYLTVFLSVILPMFNVAQSGKQETYGFMFQQTARYVKLFPDEVTEEEKEAISKVLPYDELDDLYVAHFQDPVKFKYNQNATNEEQWDYILTWASMFFKHPETYFQATFYNCYHYFIPTKNLSVSYMPMELQKSTILNEYEAFDLYNVEVPVITSLFNSLFTLLPEYLGVIFSMFIYVWTGIFCTVKSIVKKQFENLLFLLPSVISILFLFITPAIQFRYVLPLVYVAPFLLSAVFTRNKISNPDGSDQNIVENLE